MTQSIVAVFKTSADADRALDKLINLGYDPESISVVMREVEKSKTAGERKAENVAAGTASGIGTGAVLGGVAGLLLGIGALTIPGVGAILIGGPVAAALGLTGAAATTATGAMTGALAGGVVGALISLGIPEEQARQYNEVIKEGGVLLTIPLEEYESAEVEDILRDCNASDVRQFDLSK